MYNYDRRVKTATLDQGPVGRALQKHWNQLHDAEYDLTQTARDYGDAAHFMGGPAEHDAKDMLKKIETLAKEIDQLASKKFNEIVEAEARFVKKYGEPGDYADQMRNKTFPRAAASRTLLDPSKPLEGNAVAYFTVGGDARDGDPESISLQKGHVPVQEVMKYLHKRTPNAKTQPGHHPGEILVHDIGWDEKPYSYTTKLKVESRK